MHGPPWDTQHRVPFFSQIPLDSTMTIFAVRPWQNFTDFFLRKFLSVKNQKRFFIMLRSFCYNPFFKIFRVSRKKLNYIYSKNFTHKMILSIQMRHFCPEIDFLLVYCPKSENFFINCPNKRLFSHLLSQIGHFLIHCLKIDVFLSYCPKRDIFLIFDPI